MTGKDLIYKFRLSVEAVVPAFTDTEIIEFLNQAQLKLCYQLINTPFTNVLHVKTSILNPTVNNEFGPYTNSFKFNISHDALNYVSGVFIFKSKDSGAIIKLLPLEIVNSVFIRKFISYPNNIVYLDKPVLFISNLFKDITSEVFSKDLICILPNDINIDISETSSFDYEFQIDYYKTPELIKNNDVDSIELPEIADEIVNVAKTIALGSIYLGQGAQNQTQSQSQAQPQE